MHNYVLILIRLPYRSSDFVELKFSLPTLDVTAAFHWFYLVTDVISFGRSVVAGITSPKPKHPRQIPLNYHQPPPINDYIRKKKSPFLPLYHTISLLIAWYEYRSRSYQVNNLDVPSHRTTLYFRLNGRVLFCVLQVIEKISKSA